ncbi:hypothetical protein AXJ10_gp25 [Gordonia phage GordTnk2]|uniref:Uncharacterized protein n=1 Tax=Gordonia phage GordTnk2 TaxID=1622192 RepID=A0A0E3T7S8_9CAUD|nr:hypothetical protein AXJ10_gp25 [Gordonia phage GordTnk2]AKC02765.1 hypothetical protein GordTnk2_25 [Gordonia phage GordTnk2]
MSETGQRAIILATGDVAQPKLEVAVFDFDNNEYVTEWVSLPAFKAELTMESGCITTASAEIFVEKLENLSAVLDTVTVITPEENTEGE